jgi:hypothetical protein
MVRPLREAVHAECPAKVRSRREPRGVCHRLDLDYGTLGPIGTHPLPHVHFSPTDPPRCTLDASRSTNVVIDFVELVYRHFYHDVWRSWAERTWDRYYDDRNDDPDRNPFRAIVDAFARNDIGFLHANAAAIAELVGVLDREKSKLYELRMDPADRYIMTFPDRHG